MRSYFLGCFWMKINSDECSRTVWAPRMLWAACFVSHAHFVYNFNKTPWFLLMWMVRFLTFVHKDLSSGNKSLWTKGVLIKDPIRTQINKNVLIKDPVLKIRTLLETVLAILAWVMALEFVRSLKLNRPLPLSHILLTDPYAEVRFLTALCTP